MDIFEFSAQEASERSAPLAARMRPRTFDEFAGQEHILGKGKLLRRAIESDRLFSSILLYGPPGTGKTTLARLIAAQSKARFEAVSAVLAGVAELRKVISGAEERRRLYRERTRRRRPCRPSIDGSAPASANSPPAAPRVGGSANWALRT